MHLSLPPNLSLYKLVVEALKHSPVLCISLATLHSLVGAVIDVLIEEKISATLWVKLPPTAEWQTELEKYKQLGIEQAIYFCSCLGDDWEEETNVNRDPQFFPPPVTASKPLKHEYFLLVIAEAFSSLIVASQPEPVTALSLNHSQPLQAVYTLEREVIQLALEGIQGVIEGCDSTIKELLPWDVKVPLISEFEEKGLLSQLLVKQVQRTEDIIQAAITDDLRNKDELIRRIAQELRTPLTNMKTALRLLDSAQLKVAQRQRYMQLLHGECDRQNSLIRGLLELVQLDYEPQPILMRSLRLVDIVPGVVSTYQPLAQEKGIQLGYTVPAELPSVLCLETWLRQIVINLLHNSLKFTPSGGQVSVKATLQGEYIQLAFRDTGIGLTTSEIPKIFDIFYRGRSTTGEDIGAGLGLTIVQQLLLRCGGSVLVTSKLGEGSNFKVLLPVASPASAKFVL